MFTVWEAGKHWGTCARHECFWMILVLLTFIEIDRSEFSPRNNSLVKAGCLLTLLNGNQLVCKLGLESFRFR